MANPRNETAKVDVIINGEAGRKTLYQINADVRTLTRAISQMHEADNPAEYQRRMTALGQLRNRQAELNNEIRNAGKEQKGFFKEFMSGYGEVTDLVKGVTLGSLIAGGITSGISALKDLGMSIVHTYAEFEKFDAMLTNALGDAGSSRRALNNLQKFAANTPFQLSELTDSYVKLINRGIRPTMADMAAMGDIAASQGKSFDQLTEALLDAVTGEFERLKEFGIRAQKNGDMVRLSFKGMTVDVKNTSDAIKEALINFGMMEGVAGTTQKVAETVGGQLSNMSDNWDRVLTAMGKRTGGFIYSVTSHINEFLDNLVEAVKDTESRMTEQADSYAGDALASYNKKDPAAQKALLEGTKQEIAYLNKEAQKIADKLNGKGGKKIETFDEFIDLGETLKHLGARKMEEEAFLAAVAEQSKNKVGDARRKKQEDDQKAADEAVKEQEKERKRQEAAAKAAANHAKTQYKQLLSQAKELSAEGLLQAKAKNEKEIAEEEKKYDKFIDKDREFLKSKGTTAEQRAGIEKSIGDLTVAKGEAVKRLRIKQEAELQEKIKQFRMGMGDVYQTELQKETDQINKFYDAELKNTTDAEARKRIEADRARDLASAKIREEKRFQDAVDEIRGDAAVAGADADGVELARINKKYDDQIEALKKKFGIERELTAEQQAAIDLINKDRKGKIDRHTEKKEKDAAKDKIDNEKKWRDASVEAAQNTANAIFEIGKNNRNAETEQALSLLETQRERELNNKNLTEAQKKVINDKYDAEARAIKLQAWEADKQAAIESAIINGALAVVKALPNWFQVAAVGVATAAQIAVIASSKAPKFRTGGILDPSGPDHAGGGIDLVNTQTGKTIGNMEGGEPIMVLSKDTRRNNGRLISELLYNSQYRNGAPVSVNAGMAMKAMRMDHGGMIAAARVQELAGTSSTNSASTAGGQAYHGNDALVEEMRLTRKAIQDQKVILSRRAFDQDEAKMVELRDRING